MRRPLLRRAAFVAVLLAGVAGRSFTPSRLWLDEAISVAIARLPITEIPAALRHDGAPPLYYFLLHGWVRLFGTGDIAARSMSGLAAVLALPVSWVVGRRLGGPRLAAAATLILASSPFAAFFGTEARMYSLVMLLTLLGALALLRVLERPTWARAVPLGLASGALLLTHYWSAFLLAAVGLWLLWSARAPGHRRAALVALGGLCGGLLLLLPWLPSLGFQLAHTGTPWAGTPSPVATFATLAQWSADAQSISFANTASPGLVTARLLEVGIIALVTLGLFGRAADRVRLVELDLLGRPIGRELFVLCFGAVTLGVAVSIAAGAGFQPRYTAPMFVLVPLLAGLGVLALPPAIRLPVLAVVTALGLVGAASTLVNRDKTQAGEVAAVLNQRAGAGDTVVYCPDQLGPAVSRLLRSDLRQLPFPTGGDPSRVDWADYAQRNRAAQVAPFVARVLAGQQGHAIWLVYGAGYQTFGAKCQQVAAELAAARPGRVLLHANPAYYEKMQLSRYGPAP